MDDGDERLDRAFTKSGGAEIHLFDSSSQFATHADGVRPVSLGPGLPHGAVDLQVTVGEEGALDVWAHLHDSSVYHATGTHSNSKWQGLVGFSNQVGRLGVWRDPTSGVAEAFIVDMSDKVSWHRRDPVTTRWKPNEVRLSPRRAERGGRVLPHEG